MLKCYAAAFLICFILTLAVIAVAALDAAKENREAGKKPMERRDKALMLPKMVLMSALVSIPAPLTLLCYAVAAICIIASAMRE